MLLRKIFPKVLLTFTLWIFSIAHFSFCILQRIELARVEHFAKTLFSLLLLLLWISDENSLATQGAGKEFAFSLVLSDPQNWKQDNTRNHIFSPKIRVMGWIMSWLSMSFYFMQYLEIISYQRENQLALMLLPHEKQILGLMSEER